MSVFAHSSPSSSIPASNNVSNLVSPLIASIPFSLIPTIGWVQMAFFFQLMMALGCSSAALRLMRGLTPGSRKISSVPRGHRVVYSISVHTSFSLRILHLPPLATTVVMMVAVAAAVAVVRGCFGLMALRRPGAISSSSYW